MFFKCGRLSQQVQLTQKEARYEFKYGTLHGGQCHLNFILNCTWMSVNITWQKNFHEPPVQRFNNYNLWIIKASGQHCLNAWTYAHTTHTHALACSALSQHTLCTLHACCNYPCIVFLELLDACLVFYPLLMEKGQERVRELFSIVQLVQSEENEGI